MPIDVENKVNLICYIKMCLLLYNNNVNNVNSPAVYMQILSARFYILRHVKKARAFSLWISVLHDVCRLIWIHHVFSWNWFNSGPALYCSLFCATHKWSLAVNVFVRSKLKSWDVTAYVFIRVLMREVGCRSDAVWNKHNKNISVRSFFYWGTSNERCGDATVSEA